MDIPSFLKVSPPGSPAYPVVLCESTEVVCAQLQTCWQPRWKHAVVIADATTKRLIADDVAEALADRGQRVLSCHFPPGEHYKTRATKAAIEDRMLEAGVDRHACIIAVGGGVVLDVAGYVAATFMRGIAHVNVATTLLAQVDAAIGGKTAINTPHGKNLIGAIHHPRAVLLHTGALATLPDEELQSGWAEAVKHAMLSDAALFGQLVAWAEAREHALPPAAMLARCVAIKAEVVAGDDRDEGKRNILNYGHTAAHAIEHATEHRMAHGQAVAVGMVIEARAALQAGRFPAHDLERLIALLSALGLPTTPPCTFDEASAFLTRDKKTIDGEVRCAIPARIGTTTPEADGAWTRVVTTEQMRNAWLP